ncbi:VTT domain-containing protein [Neisseriaceae bacterium JH1-16]|nr:VTT domain-containing protein [Neisseriaceae bacterium JH1-16]
MLFTSLLSWLSSEQGMMALLAQNWLLGTGLIAMIVFLETGVVVMPFLSGDSLLFAGGAFLGLAGISPVLPMVLIAGAAIAGDSANYAIGRSALGQQIVRRGWIKPAHLAKTKVYFDRFGGPTVSIGRFLPIVRTVSPFLAGLTGMCPRRFMLFNVLGGVVWCASLVLAGYWLGQISWVRDHLSSLTMGVVAVSLLPAGIHLLIRRFKTKEPEHAGIAGRR